MKWFSSYLSNRKQKVSLNGCVSDFKYNSKETIHIHYLIKQYVKHEMFWRQNVLLKKEVMLIFTQDYRQARPDEQTDADREKAAVVCNRL